jgi:hypothetical protein
MSVKLNIGLSRKVGEASFGSRGASINLEVELDNGVLNDPGQLRDRVQDLYVLARQSVDEELQRPAEAGPSEPSHTNGNGHGRISHTANGNGHKNGHANGHGTNGRVTNGHSPTQRQRDTDESRWRGRRRVRSAPSLPSANARDSILTRSSVNATEFTRWKNSRSAKPVR